MEDEYPEVQGGGSLILAWQIRRKNVLVVGGGEVSTTVPAKYRLALLTYMPGRCRTNTQST